ncbi:hypothetical protein D3C85_1584970 [compost metagenome]
MLHLQADKRPIALVPAVDLDSSDPVEQYLEGVKRLYLPHPILDSWHRGNHKLPTSFDTASPH